MLVARPTPTMTEPLSPNSSADRLDRSWDDSSNAIEPRAKQPATSGAIRPGWENQREIYGGPSSSSIPRFRPRTYSATVRTLMVPTIPADTTTTHLGPLRHAVAMARPDS